MGDGGREKEKETLIGCFLYAPQWGTELATWVMCPDQKSNLALAGVAQWIECSLQSKGSLVQFPVRAHAWVSGLVPSRGSVRGNHTLIDISLPPFPL